MAEVNEDTHNNRESERDFSVVVRHSCDWHRRYLYSTLPAGALHLHAGERDWGRSTAPPRILGDFFLEMATSNRSPPGMGDMSVGHCTFCWALCRILVDIPVVASAHFSIHLSRDWTRDGSWPDDTPANGHQRKRPTIYAWQPLMSILITFLSQYLRWVASN